MEYAFETWSIKDLYDKYEAGNLDLNPPYQRNEIWSLRSKRDLLDSIQKKYPLPAFFVYEREEGDFEMVDGQQRSRAIFGYIKNIFSDSQKNLFDEENQEFWDYNLPVIKITKMDDPGIIEDLYTRINKLGMKLNRPELKKAEYFGTNFLKLSEELAADEEFEELNLFTAHSINRMNDLDFITELLALLKFGITDKKKKADDLFEKDIDDDEYDQLKDQFKSVLNRLSFFNSIHSIKNTRYRQKNDFYTLFSFLKDSFDRSDKYWNIFYSSLLYFEQDISPSNDDCYVFQDYAYYCVTQSNSSKARNERLSVLTSLFSNTGRSFNENQINVLKYYDKTSENPSLEVDGFYMIDVNILED
jgi:hypothetical protein